MVLAGQLYMSCGTYLQNALSGSDYHTVSLSAKEKALCYFAVYLTTHPASHKATDYTSALKEAVFLMMLYWMLRLLVLILILLIVWFSPWEYNWKNIMEKVLGINMQSSCQELMIMPTYYMVKTTLATIVHLIFIGAQEHLTYQ